MAPRTGSDARLARTRAGRRPFRRGKHRHRSAWVFSSPGRTIRERSRSGSRWAERRTGMGSRSRLARQNGSVPANATATASKKGVIQRSVWWVPLVNGISRVSFHRPRSGSSNRWRNQRRSCALRHRIPDGDGVAQGRQRLGEMHPVLGGLVLPSSRSNFVVHQNLEGV